MQGVPPWLTIVLLFVGSFLFFGRVYRVALTWFVRARINRYWEVWAELVTFAASVPFATIYGILSIEAILFAARLTMGSKLSFSILPALIEFTDTRKFWLSVILMLLFLARMVPQTIAGSKVYAYGIEEKIRNEVPGK